jgi:hypothetical protein
MLILFKGGSAPGVPVVLPLRVQPLLELQVSPGVWVDLTPYWRADTPILCRYGIEGSDPSDCVASSGTLQFDLDNGARAGVPLGYTSSVSATRLPGWRLNAEVRFSIGQLGGGPRTFKFRGALSAAQPDDTGQHGARRTVCTVLDWWNTAATIAAPEIIAVQNINSGDAITLLMNNVPPYATVTHPGSRAIDTGVETFAWCFDGGAARGTTVRERLNEICLSEGGGKAYTRGTTDAAAALFVYESRNHRVNPVSTFALTDAHISSLVLATSSDDLYNHVRVFVHPLKLDQAPTTVVTLETTSTFVPANSTLLGLYVPYLAVGTTDAIGAIGMIQPVPTVDYTANTSADGSGTDLTGVFTVVAEDVGTGVVFTIANTGGADGYVTPPLQVRAQGLYRSDAQVDRDVPGATYGAGLLEYDMPFTSNVNTANALATSFQDKYGQPYARVESVTFCATKTQALFDFARLVEPGFPITITEATTGLAAQMFVVNSVSYELEGSGLMWCSLGVEQAVAAHVWELDTDLLDTGTTLGF